MCLSELGDIVKKDPSQNDAAQQQQAPDRATLCSSVESLVEAIRGIQPTVKATRIADVGLLGAGLVTSSELMKPKYGNREMRKGLQQQAHRLQDVLISQSREYLASQLPDASSTAASGGSWQGPVQNLLVVRPPPRTANGN